MQILAVISVVVVALLHIYFLILEMYFWEKPLGLKVFGLDPEFAKASRAIAANQGLYNGFLAAGLIWGVSMGSAGNPINVFFLVCIIIAGLFGAITANRKILYFQALTAVVALTMVCLVTAGF